MADRGNILALALLGLCGLSGVVGAIWLSLEGRPIPEAVTAISSTCIGALGMYISREGDRAR